MNLIFPPKYNLAEYCHDIPFFGDLLRSLVIGGMDVDLGEQVYGHLKRCLENES
jgi:hypothetical protein